MDRTTFIFLCLVFGALSVMALASMVSAPGGILLGIAFLVASAWYNGFFYELASGPWVVSKGEDDES